MIKCYRDYLNSSNHEVPELSDEELILMEFYWREIPRLALWEEWRDELEGSEVVSDRLVEDCEYGQILHEVLDRRVGFRNPNDTLLGHYMQRMNLLNQLFWASV